MKNNYNRVINTLQGAAGLGLAMAVSFTAVSAHAKTGDNFPDRPIRMIVGFAPGGGTDLIARIVAQKMSQKLGQPVVVENRPGAGGNIGAEAAMKSANDGYTLYLTSNSYAVNANLYKLSFDPVNDITPIAQIASGPFLVAANPNTGINSIQDFVDMAQKDPGKLSYASAGSGSITHVATEYFLSTANIDVMHVPYKGTSPALIDTISGQVQVIFGSVTSTVPHVKSGKLKALAVTTPKRLATLPDVPTIIESGYPNFEVSIWHGIIGPKDIPSAVVNKLNRAVNEAMSDPSMEKQLTGDGLTAASVSPDQFGSLIKEDIKRWGAVAKSRGIALN